MKNTNLIVLMLCCYSICAAQSIHYPSAAPYTHAGAYSKNFSSIMSASANTASLASLKQFSAGVYGERRFMLSETSMYTAALGLPTASGNFALLTDYFGYSGYNQSEISVAYARKLADNIDIGAAINYYGIRIQGYGNASAFHFQLGSVFHISERLHTGIQIYNPLSVAIGKQTGLKLASV